MRVIIKQGRACNNDCVFCHASDRTLRADSVLRIEAKVAAARSAGAHTIVLSGGEPTVRADLLRVADLIHQAGLRLGLITNARRLADPSLVDALVARGLDYAYVSLHGSCPAIHDQLVGAPAFHETLAGIRNLHGAVATLCVNTVVTLANLDDLPRIVDLLGPLPALTQKFTMPQPKGAAWDHFDHVVPNLRDAADAVIRAIDHATRQRSMPRERFGFEGFPLCLLPGFEDLLSDLRSHEIAWMSEPEDDGIEPVDDALLTKPRRCAACTLRARCPGIYIGYLQRRGDAELKPVVDVHGPRETGADVLDVDRVVAAAAAREDAAHEQRMWVRLTYACNNRCVFCLDRGVDRSSHRPAEQVRREILDGRARGAQRLILSGGEATTHPAFLDFVVAGKKAGYRWVQCVSNGRMFAYPKFVARAIHAGLDEITFSMHGHNADLHDRLVGVPGAFEQASRGIRNVLRSARIVANIDVVINAINVRHLPEMLETFVGWGVREFDLLHLIPFGGAWEPQNRDLFYDPAEHIEALRAAFAFSRRPGIQIWLNRFPPAYAEGFEALIQDPHKLHDEVRGRAEEFRAYLSGGPALACRDPERCDRCYLHDTCAALDRALSSSRLPRVDKVRLALPARPAIPIPASDLLEIEAPSVADVLALLPLVSTNRLRLRLKDLASLASSISPDGSLHGVPVDAVIVSTPAGIDDALALPDRIDVVVELDTRTAAHLRALPEHAPRFVVTQPAHDRIADALAADVDLPSWFRDLPFLVRTESIAPCLSGILPEPCVEALDMDAFDDDGHLDAGRFVSVFIRHGFMTRSLRCNTCSQRMSCRGMHINWVRAHGYALMRPDRCDNLARPPTKPA